MKASRRRLKGTALQEMSHLRRTKNLRFTAIGMLPMLAL
jgi:hypothetical protein